MDRELRERLTRARVSAYNPIVFDWVDEEVFAERLNAETGNLIERTRDDDFAARLMRRFPVAGVDEVSAYRDALVDLPDGGIALAGVRFSRGDPDKPFVDVSVIEGSVDAARLAVVTEVLEARWSDSPRFAFGCRVLPLPTA